MKKINTIICLLFFLCFVKESYTQNNQKKIYITTKVVFCNSYCGGAYPGEEILEHYKQEYVFSNSTFILKKDSSNKKIKVSTDSNGIFNAYLAPGKYHFYMTKQYNKKIGTNFNPDCNVWLSKVFGELEVLPKESKYKMVYSFGCSPCEPPRP